MRQATRDGERGRTGGGLRAWTRSSATRAAGTRWPASAGPPARWSGGSTGRTGRPARPSPRSPWGRRCCSGSAAAVATRRHPVARAALVAAGTWTVLGGRTLRHEARVMGRALRRRRPARRPRPARPPLRSGPVRAGRAGAGPGHRRVGRREHLRRRRRAAALGRGRRAARPARLPRGEHARRHGRAPLAPATPGSAPPAARLDDLLNLVPRPADRAAHRRRRAGRRTATAAAPGRSGAATATTIRAPTPASARPPWPARWASGWAGATSTSVGPRCARSSATAPARGAAPQAGRPDLRRRGRRRARDRGVYPLTVGRLVDAPAGWPARSARSRGRARRVRSRRVRHRPAARGCGPCAPGHRSRGAAAASAGAARGAGDERRAAGRRHHLRRRQERAHRRHLPVAAPAGVKVAPFKAQNMSNNSAVVVGPDGRGGEIGRAQAMQAAACGLAPDLRFNPVLLKPGSDLRQPGGAARRGRRTRSPPATTASCGPGCAGTAFAALAELRGDVRRGDLRGRRQPGRDQPAGAATT